jgi:hypothetical protein
MTDHIPPQREELSIRDILVDLYYKGYHEGKGDQPNMDDVETTRAEQLILEQTHKDTIREVEELPLMTLDNITNEVLTFREAYQRKGANDVRVQLKLELEQLKGQSNAAKQ